MKHHPVGDQILPLWELHENQAGAGADYPPRSLLAVRQDSWRNHAVDAWLCYIEGTLSFADAMGRTIRAGKELARSRDETEAELHAEVETILEDAGR